VRGLTERLRALFESHPGVRRGLFSLFGFPTGIRGGGLVKIQAGFAKAGVPKNGAESPSFF